MYNYSQFQNISSLAAFNVKCNVAAEGWYFYRCLALLEGSVAPSQSNIYSVLSWLRLYKYERVMLNSEPNYLQGLKLDRR